MNIGAQETDAAWVLAWQTKLHRWATTNKEQKFKDIYNLACDPRTLRAAWQHIRANKGSRTAGVDGLTRYKIEQGLGLEKFLDGIREDLRNGTYRPRLVREKGIPKANGKIRYLGIPTMRDRVVQQALKMVLEPIWETDFYASSYAYRPGRRSQDAIQEIRQFTGPRTGRYEWIVEGDIRACFDNVHHGVLLEEIRKRITDRKVIWLVRSFLKAGVMTELGVVRKTITGTPQGGILSPVLANLYLSRLDRHFIRKWEGYKSYGNRYWLRKKGLATCYLVRFADDFVILIRGTREQAESLKEETAELLEEDLCMELSWEKTRITHIGEGIDFLGFHVVLKPDQWGHKAIRIYPSKESLRSVQEKVKKITCKSTTGSSLADTIGRLNPVLRGWTYYFRFAHSKKTFSYLRYYTWLRVYGWMRKKHRGLPLRVLKRKYFPKWTFQEGGQVLFDPGAVRVERYGYRGVRIPTPWTQNERSAPRRRGDGLPDEPGILDYLERCCEI